MASGGGSFELVGWVGYNARFNGLYTLSGETRDGRPIFRHMHTGGVGAGHDWCRMYWAHGFWKIGHVSWVHAQPQICCAGVGSHAMHPSEIPAHEQWYEHTGTSAGQDFGSDPKDFKPQPGQVHVVTASGGGSDTHCIGATHCKPGPRLTYADSEAYAAKMGGRLLTLEEAKALMGRRPLYPGEDQWCAVQGRDWVQVGSGNHHPGKSHNCECGGYPRWGDDANCNCTQPPHVALYKTGGGGASHGGGGVHRGAKGTWAHYSNIDMCGQGDVEIIGDWKRKHSIDDLKRMVEERGYSAFTVSAGQPSFGHAALKRFPFELTKEHCKPISTCCRHPCTIYILTPAGSGLGQEAVDVHTAGGSASLEPPVVMGMPVGEAMGSIAKAVAVEPAASPVGVVGEVKAPMPLIEQVEVFKRELGLEGNVKAVIEQAAEQLGVPAKGRSLSELAAACMEVLGR